MTKLPKDLQEQIDQLTLEQKKQLIDYLIDRVETQQEQIQQETRVLLARLYTLNSNLFLQFSSDSSWAQMRNTVKTKKHEKVKEPDKSLEPRTPGLHEHLGHAWMSEDFDDPLPDSFWPSDTM